VLPARPAGAHLVARGAAAVRETRLARAHAAGERTGRAQAGALLDQAVTRLAALETDARDQLARAATELALEIARTLLRREIPRGNYDLETIVRETLAEAATGRSACVVHLNPADLARLAEVRFRSGTRLEPDEGVPRGDVHVETALGLLVRDLDASLDSIAKRLQEEHA
jgi:flagellar biosynthesis/type III secretory pathway protein FliH